MTGRWNLAKAVAATALVGLGATCNIWGSLTNCETDSNCASSETCEPNVKRCVPKNEGSLADASKDADPSDSRSLDGDVDSSDAADHDVEAATACEALPWGEPKLVLGLENTPVASARLSPDELDMVLTVGDPIGNSNVMSTASRTSLTEPFHINGPIAVVNAQGTSAFWATMSANSLLLFFESDRTPEVDDAGLHGRGGIRIWTASRVSPLADFSEPRLQTLFDVSVAPEKAEAAPYVHPSGRSLYFASSARGGHGGLDIFVAAINGLGSVTSVTNIDEVNTSTFENTPAVTLDEKYLYYSSYVGTVTTRVKVFLANRASKDAKFGNVHRVDALNSGMDFDDYPSWVSPDHCHIYIVSSRPGGDFDAGTTNLRIWMAERTR